jgi:hypothetical protein
MMAALQHVPACLPFSIHSMLELKRQSYVQVRHPVPGAPCKAAVSFTLQQHC